jgi:hypothetical protein
MEEKSLAGCLEVLLGAHFDAVAFQSFGKDAISGDVAATEGAVVFYTRTPKR